MQCYVFIPGDLEAAKVLGNLIYRPNVVEVEGNYDDVNRLCTQVADRYGWGFVNINLRSYYAEGAKTLGFEVVEQRKSGHFVQVLFQLAALYVHELARPVPSVALRYLLSMLFIAPINVVGSLASMLLPGERSLYFGNVLLLEKRAARQIPTR